MTLASVFSKQEQQSPEATFSPVLTGLGALYLALLVSQTILQPYLSSIPLMLMGTATVLLFFGTRWLISHRKISAQTFESLSAGIAGSVILHSILHIYLLSNFTGTTNLALLALGILTFFLTIQRLIVVVTVTLSAWVVLAVIGEPSEAWLHFAFGLFLAAGLKLYTSFRNLEITGAVTSARTQQSTIDRLAAQLEETEERLENIIQANEAGLWEWNLNNDEMLFSPRWQEMLGLENSMEHSPDAWFARVRPNFQPQLQSLATRVTQDNPRFCQEYEILHTDGKLRWMSTHGIARFNQDGTPVSLTGFQVDTTEKKSLEKALFKRRFRDELTGLCNRDLFLKQVRDELRASQIDSPEHGVAVVIADIDRFRNTNNRYGFEHGNELLKAVSQRLQSRCQATVVARLETDRFALLYSKQANPLDALSQASKVQQAFSERFWAGEHRVALTASIGSTWGHQGDAPEELLRQAFNAMREAKAGGVDRCTLFDPAQDDDSFRQAELQCELRDAVQNDELKLVYQPVMALKTGDIVGLASQMRWKHPGRGLLFPEEFLTAATETGLESSLYWWNFNEACQRMRHWQDRFPGCPLFSISIQMGSRQLADFNLVERVFSYIDQAGLSSDAIHLELTEENLGAHPETALSMLSELQEGGVGIHLANFATQKSSPSLLDRFKFDAIKLDPCYMRGIANSAQKCKAVAALLEFLRKVSVDVVVDGLDSARQVELAEGLGCLYGQGNYFWPALDSEMLDAILKENSASSKH